METSKINIRPFIPCMKDEEKDGREEFAVLTYGNVRVEIDQTILGYLSLNSESDLMQKTCCIFSAAIKEMEKEMWTNIEGKIPPHHRDSGTTFVSNFTHNPLHLDNENVTIDITT